MAGNTWAEIGRMLANSGGDGGMAARYRAARTADAMLSAEGRRRQQIGLQNLPRNLQGTSLSPEAQALVAALANAGQRVSMSQVGDYQTGQQTRKYRREAVNAPNNDVANRLLAAASNKLDTVYTPAGDAGVLDRGTGKETPGTLTAAELAHKKAQTKAADALAVKRGTPGGTPGDKILSVSDMTRLFTVPSSEKIVNGNYVKVGRHVDHAAQMEFVHWLRANDLPRKYANYMRWLELKKSGAAGSGAPGTSDAPASGTGSDPLGLFSGG